MDTKKISIIALTIILVALIALGTYLYISNQGPEYQNVHITDTFSLDIPVSDNITNKTISNRINVINDTKNDVIITSFNSAGTSLDEMLTDGTQLAATRDAFKVGSEQITIANQTVWHNEGTGYYMVYYTSEQTHDNVVIACKNNDTMAHMISSVNDTGDVAIAK